MKNALLLIDIQNDYFPGGKMELVGSEAAAANAAKLLAYFRDTQQLVVHIQHISTQAGATFFVPATPGSDIHSAVTPLPSESLFIKHFPNSFRDTCLSHFLKGSKVQRLVVAGMMSHMCVDSTVRSAFDHGIDCVVAHDACATRDLSFNGTAVPAAQVHAAYMSALNMRFAKVVDCEEAVKLAMK